MGPSLGPGGELRGKFLEKKTSGSRVLPVFFFGFLGFWGVFLQISRVFSWVFKGFSRVFPSFFMGFLGDF